MNSSLSIYYIKKSLTYLISFHTCCHFSLDCRVANLHPLLSSPSLWIPDKQVKLAILIPVILQVLKVCILSIFLITDITYTQMRVKLCIWVVNIFVIFVFVEYLSFCRIMPMYELKMVSFRQYSRALNHNVIEIQHGNILVFKCVTDTNFPNFKSCHMKQMSTWLHQNPPHI